MTVSGLIEYQLNCDTDLVMSRDLDCLPLDWLLMVNNFWINVIVYPDEPIQRILITVDSRYLDFAYLE